MMTVLTYSNIMLKAVLLFTTIITMVKSITSPAWTKSFKIFGWVGEVEIVGPYLVSEYSGNLKYVLSDLNAKNNFNISTKDLIFPKDSVSTKFDIYAIRKTSQTSTSVVIAGFGKTAYLVDFSTGNEGKIIRPFEMEAEVLYPEVLVIGTSLRHFPDNFFISCDNKWIYRFSVSQQRHMSRFEHGLDMIKEIAINRVHYLASGIQRYLILANVVDGAILHKFTTGNLISESGIHRINAITSID